MAIVNGIFQINGSVKGVTFYTRRGSDKVIMRSKGGPSKQRMATGQEFEKLRNHQKEWGACVLFAKQIKHALGSSYALADYNLAPVMTGIGKRLMKLDTVNPIGERRLYLTSYRQALEGFDMNKNYPLNTVLRVLPTGIINREELSATVSFPRIVTEKDILNVRNLPYFRLRMTLGVISDIGFDPQNLFNNYSPLNPMLHGISALSDTDWMPANNLIESCTLHVGLNKELRQELSENVTLLLSVAIEFGEVGFGGQITEVKYAGCGKVILCG